MLFTARSLCRIQVGNTVLLIFVVLLAPFLLHAQTTERAEEFRHAKQLILGGKPEQAIPIYEKLLAESPDNPTLLQNLAVAQFKAGRWQDVVDQCRNILKLRPDSAFAWLFLGGGYFQMGEYSKAVEPLRKALRVHPKERNARLMLAHALLQLGRFAEAGEVFHQVSEFLPDDPQVWYGMERSYRTLSSRAITKLKEIAPQSGYWLTLLADSFLAQKRYGSALHFFRLALAATPNLRGAHRELAALYRATSHPEWAAQEEAKERALPPPDCAKDKLECDYVAGRFRQIASAEPLPESPAGLYWYARACKILADKAYTRLFELPDSALRHELIARAHENQFRHREAAVEWRKALQMSPGNRSLEYGLAVSLYRIRDFDTALPILKKLLQGEPNSADLNYLVGNSYLQLKQPGEAVQYLENSVKAKPGFAAAEGALGQAYLETNRPEKAIPHIKAGLETDSNGKAHFRLARAYRMTGQTELAKKAVLEYQKIRKAAEKKQQEIETTYTVTGP